MTIATSQPSALNPLGDEQLVGVSVTGTFPNQGGDLQGVVVGGTRVSETLEGVTVTGTNAPIDAQRLEGVIVSGTRRKKSEPMHLYYPQALADPTSEFKNAIQLSINKRTHLRLYQTKFQLSNKSLKSLDNLQDFQSVLAVQRQHMHF